MPDGSLEFGKSGIPSDKAKPVTKLEVTVAQSIEDIMRITAIRGAVYMAEQNYSYAEEFDGNDFCGTHIIGWVNGEPVACLRIRYFGGFAKVERIAVRLQYRKTRIAFKMIRFAFNHCLKKGFTKVLGHVREELIPLYKMFGCRVDEKGRTMVLSDFAYTEMIFESELPEDAITLESDPLMLIETEGEWSKATPQKTDQPAASDDSFAIAAE